MARLGIILVLKDTRLNKLLRFQSLNSSESIWNKILTYAFILGDHTFLYQRRSTQHGMRQSVQGSCIGLTHHKHTYRSPYAHLSDLSLFSRLKPWWGSTKCPRNRKRTKGMEAKGLRVLATGTLSRKSLAVSLCMILCEWFLNFRTLSPYEGHTDKSHTPTRLNLAFGRWIDGDPIVIPCLFCAENSKILTVYRKPKDNLLGFITSAWDCVEMCKMRCVSLSLCCRWWTY